jgi:hypothetical protein
MAGIGGTKKEFSEVDFSKKIGIFEGKVVKINPTKEELEELLNTKFEGDKEIEYLGETEEGETKLSLSFWLQDVETQQVFNLRFFLVDKERENKDKTKKQYVNLSAACSWADSPNNLPEWFKKKEFRVAKVGEEELYEFLRSWLNQLDWNTNEDFLEFKKLMRGNVKELIDLGKSEYAGTVVVSAIVRTVDTDNGAKEYQGVYNKAFLPGNMIKMFRVKSSKTSKLMTRFVNTISDKDYGCKDAYSLELLHDYDSSKHLPATDKIISADDDSY